MTDHPATDPVDSTDPADVDDRLQRRRKVLMALGAGTAAWVLPSITTMSGSAAATGSTATTPTTGSSTTTTTAPTTTTTEAPTTTTTEAPTTTTTAPSGLVLDHDLTHSYGTLPLWAGGFSAEVWQQIAPTSSGVLSRIVVQGRGTGSPLTVNVYRVRTQASTSFPDGPSLGEASIPAPTTEGFASRTFDLSVPVEAGTTYLLVFSVPVEGPSYGWNLSFGNPTSGLPAYLKHTDSFPAAWGSLVLQTYLLPN